MCSGDLEIIDCIFLKTLILNKSRIEGGVTLKNTSFLGGEKQENIMAEKGSIGTLRLNMLKARFVLFKSVSINGILAMEDLDIQGSVRFLSGNRFSENSNSKLAFIVHGAFVLNHLHAKYVEMNSVAIAGSFSMQYAVIEQFVQFDSEQDYFIEEQFDDPVRMRIGYNIANTGFTVALCLYGLSVETNYLQISSCEIYGSADLGRSHIGSYLLIDNSSRKGNIRSEIKGSLSLKRTKAQDIYLFGVLIECDVKGIGLECGSLQMSPSFQQEFDESEASLKPNGLVDRLEVGGQIDLSESKIKLDALLVGLSTNRHNGEVSDDTCSLNLRRAEIMGNLRLYQGLGELRETFDNKKIDKALHTEMPNGIKLRKIKVGGEVDLSYIQCDRGTIDITDGYVERDFSIKIDDKKLLVKEFAYISSLIADSFFCGGDLNLTGLKLVDKCIEEKELYPDTRGREDFGSILIRDAEIRGHLITYMDEEIYTRFPTGELDLESSSMGHLSISAHNNKCGCKEESDQKVKGINLTHTVIDTLSVVVNNNEFPFPVKQQFMEVKKWDFPDNNSNNDDERNHGSESHRTILGF